MRSANHFHALLLAAVAAGAGSPQPVHRIPPADSVYAFRDVTVLGPDRIEHQTVVITADRITALGPEGRVEIPPDATIIDATGKFLIPGLADMHVHLPGADSTGISTRNTLTLFLANGVTTVRVMSAIPRHIAVRDSVRRGEILGPRMYLAGSAVGGLAPGTDDLRRVLTPGETRRFAEEMKRAGYDFIQITAGMLRPEYEGLVSAAKRVGIAITGGVPNDVGFERVLRSRQASIENLEGYLPLLERDDSPLRYADPVTRARRLVQFVDSSRIPRIAADLKQAGVSNTPTLFLTHVAFTAVSGADMAQWPEMRYVSPPTLEDWVRRKQRAAETESDATDAPSFIAFRGLMVRALARSGARILVGSDAPAAFIVPGFGTIYEMHTMTVSGMPVDAVLAAATRSAAEFMGAENEFGTIAPGQAADLVLLEADPLADIANLTRRAGVMVRGQWLPADTLSAMLERVAATNGVGAGRVRDR